MTRDGPYVAHPSTSTWTFGRDAARERLHGCLMTALDHGHLTGTAIVQDVDGVWVCWSWQQTTPNWVALAVGEAPSEEDVRKLVAGRLAEEVERHLAPHP